MAQRHKIAPSIAYGKAKPEEIAHIEALSPGTKERIATFLDSRPDREMIAKVERLADELAPFVPKAVNAKAALIRRKLDGKLQ